MRYPLRRVVKILPALLALLVFPPSGSAEFDSGPYRKAVESALRDFSANRGIDDASLEFDQAFRKIFEVARIVEGQFVQTVSAAEFLQKVIAAIPALSEAQEYINSDSIADAALSIALNRMDPSSRYISKNTNNSLRKPEAGKPLGSVGLELTMTDGAVRVLASLDDTPARRAGIGPGDNITHIDGEALRGATLADAARMMKGPIGSDVVFTVKRGDGRPIDLHMKRERLRLKGAASHMDGNFSIIRIGIFLFDTAGKVARTVDGIASRSGVAPRAIVFDLRNNPGGLLDAGVKVADTFLAKGTILSTRGREVQKNRLYVAGQVDRSGGLPIVVLIDAGSSGAAEIVAAALQDHQRAVIMGGRSLGLGGIRNVVPLREGGALVLTTQRYFRPSGQSIAGHGVVPDIEFDKMGCERFTAFDDSQLACVLATLRDGSWVGKVEVSAHLRSLLDEFSRR